MMGDHDARSPASALLALAVLVAAGCAAAANGVHDRADSYRAEGQASYYSDKLDGNRTASGEPYDKRKLTAAHRTLPFGTRVRVTNLDNGKVTTVTINDRGPFKHGRIIDLSRRAAEQLDFVRQGLTRVRVETVD